MRVTESLTLGPDIDSVTWRWRRLVALLCSLVFIGPPTTIQPQGAGLYPLGGIHHELNKTDRKVGAENVRKRHTLFSPELPPLSLLPMN